MTSVRETALPAQASGYLRQTHRRALGAAERHRWSSVVRQEEIDIVLGMLQDPELFGTAILGPRGVGKTTLARSVSRRLEDSSHVVRLFGANAPTEVPYTIFTVHLARLSSRQTESPEAVLSGLVELISQDAGGRPIVVITDDLPGMDTMSMGVLLHLVLGGMAKLLVIGRTLADFPEDLTRMIRDGMLGQHRIGPFTRTEVRALLVRTLGASVAESVVASLHIASSGNPLVLQALVHEYLGSGVLRERDGVWVQLGSLDKYTDDVLRELVESRMAKETDQLRRNIEKFSMFSGVPLNAAIDVFGPEAVGAMEERGFLVIGHDLRKTVGFTDHYVGEIVRSQLSSEQKAVYLKELSGGLMLDPAKMTMQELLRYAAWCDEAGLKMDPAVALAAAQAAIHYADPVLALACCAHVPPGHYLEVLAAQKRSRAHYLMANYDKAVGILENVSPDALAAVDSQAFAEWAMDLIIALQWMPDAEARTAEVLAAAEKRVCQGSVAHQVAGQRFLNLARFEAKIHSGEFLDVLPDLEKGSRNADDHSYRLNCASLLTMALAATGREQDAVELSQVIDAESLRHDVVFRMNDWHLYGRILAQIWNGEWRSSEGALLRLLERSNTALEFRGGAIELALGVVYIFAGRHEQAAAVLHSAAVQLEGRDTYKSLELVYSALACAHTWLGDSNLAVKYLSMATSVRAKTVWINRTLADFFQGRSLSSLSDSAVAARMVATAEVDLEKGRVSPASTWLLGAVMAGAKDQYDLLEVAARQCQGPLAAINLLLVKAHRDEAAQPALDAADKAASLDLAPIQRHANEYALELALAAGDGRLVREARNRLSATAPAQVHQREEAIAALTARERQVGRLAAEGMNNQDIAIKLSISVRTVEGHLYKMFAKTGITSRSELEEWMRP